MIQKYLVIACLAAIALPAAADDFEDVAKSLPFARPVVREESPPVDPGVTLTADSDEKTEKPVPKKTTAPVNTPEPSQTEVNRETKNAADMVYPVDSSMINLPSAHLLKSSSQRIVVESGVNSLVPIAIGQINRIVTPFTSPTVQKLKLDTVRVTVESNVLYVFTTSTQPVALFVSEKGDESVALSLSLIPQKIAPVQATLVMNSQGQPYRSARQEAIAQRYEQKDNYVETIGRSLRTVALGEVPPGYITQTLSQSAIGAPDCNFRTRTSQDDIQYDFSHAQVITGNKYSVIIGTARNTGRHSVTVDESLCRHPAMVARALWSHNVLQPGQITEAYFMISNEQPSRPADKRVRLAD